jgi:type I restriction enzyme S subunit
MELRPGYKLTEVGVIPEAWDAVLLDSCVQSSAPISYGILMPGPHTPGGVPVVKVRDIADGRVEEADLLLTHRSIDQAYRRSRLTDGDLLITIRGTTGRVAAVSERLSGANITQDTARVRIKDEVDPRFVYFALQSEPLQHQIALHTIGQAVRGINIRDVRRLVLGLPRLLAEQRTIAAPLSALDALTDGLTRLIAKKRDLKKAAVHQLLSGQTRLPGFREEWEHVRLGDLFSFKNGLNKAKSFFGSGVPIVNYMDVFGCSQLRSSNVSGRVQLAATEIKNFGVQKSDVLFTRTSETVDDVGIAAVVLDEPIDTVFSGFLLRARPLDKRMSDLFKVYCFASATVRKQIIAKASYTTRALTNGLLLSKVVLPLPPLPEQIAIAEVLSDMDTELAALEARRDKTRALKQAMMQELLTGRTRLV